MREQSEAEIRERIEQTRARLGDTIEQIGDRVNPDRVQRELKSRAREQIHDMKDSVKQKAREKMHDVEHEVKDAGRGVWQTIRENPLPAGMVGVGLAWLFANRKSGHSRGWRPYPYSDTGYSSARYGSSAPYVSAPRGFDPNYTGAMPTGGYTAAGGYMGDEYETQRDRGSAGAERPRVNYDGSPGNDAGRMSASQDSDGLRGRAEHAKDAVREKAGDAVDAVRDAAGSVRDTASHVADSASERLHDVQHRVEHWADSAQERARRVEYRVEHAVEDNPLAAGAMALAIGFAAGMLVPETQKEHEVLGRTRDRFIDSAEDQVRRTGEKLRESAKESAGKAAREAVDHMWPVGADGESRDESVSEPRR